MSDISKCPGTGCPVRNTCLRYTMRARGLRQLWLAEMPGEMVLVKGNRRWECDFYLSNRPYRRLYELG